MYSYRHMGIRLDNGYRVDISSTNTGPSFGPIMVQKGSKREGQS